MQYDLVLCIFTASASPVDYRHPCENCGAFVTSNGGLCVQCLD